MSHISAYSYKIIFKFLIELIENIKNNFNFNEAHLMIDFELSLRKVTIEIYPKCYLEESYFNYSKSKVRLSK